MFEVFLSSFEFAWESGEELVVGAQAHRESSAAESKKGLCFIVGAG